MSSGPEPSKGKDTSRIPHAFAYPEGTQSPASQNSDLVEERADNLVLPDRCWTWKVLATEGYPCPRRRGG